MKRWTTIFLVVALAAIIAGPARAQVGGSSALCNLTFVQRFEPGFTLTPSSGAQFSAEESPIHCSGTIQGHQVTGPGTVSNDGTYHNSTCLLDSAKGTVSLTVPTDAGLVPLDGTFKVTRVGPLLSVELELAGSKGVGQAAVIPTKGDCALTPVTEASVIMSVTIRDRQPATVQTKCDLDLVVVKVACRTRS